MAVFFFLLRQHTVSKTAVERAQVRGGREATGKEPAFLSDRCRSPGAAGMSYIRPLTPFIHLLVCLFNRYLYMLSALSQALG